MAIRLRDARNSSYSSVFLERPLGSEVRIRPIEKLPFELILRLNGR